MWQQLPGQKPTVAPKGGHILSKSDARWRSSTLSSTHFSAPGPLAQSHPSHPRHAQTIRGWIFPAAAVASCRARWPVSTCWNFRQASSVWFFDEVGLMRHDASKLATSHAKRHAMAKLVNLGEKYCGSHGSASKERLSKETQQGVASILDPVVTSVDRQRRGPTSQLCAGKLHSNLGGHSQLVSSQQRASTEGVESQQNTPRGHFWCAHIGKCWTGFGGLAERTIIAM